MINDNIQSIELSTVEEAEKPKIMMIKYLHSEAGVFTNLWTVADTDGCGDPDCGCDGD